MRRRRHRHRRSWLRRLRRSFRGVGVLFIVALVGIVAIVWVILPVVEQTFFAFLRGPDAATIAELQRRAKAK